jgi:hypothetical protein
MRHEPNLGDKKSVADIFMSMLKAEGPLTLFDTAILVSGAAASSSSVPAPISDQRLFFFGWHGKMRRRP